MPNCVATGAESLGEASEPPAPPPPHHVKLAQYEWLGLKGVGKIRNKETRVMEDMKMKMVWWNTGEKK